MNTTIGYIEHYIDLHKYINDNYIKLNNDPNNYLCEITLLEFILATAGINFIAKTIYSLITDFKIDPSINKLKKFRDNFKEIQLTSNQLDLIISNQKYSNLNLTDSELKNIINDLNKINKTDSFYDQIIKNSTKIQNLIKLIAFFINSLMDIITNLSKQSKLNEEKIKQLHAIIIINNELTSLNINKNFNYQKFSSIFEDIYNLEPIRKLSFMNARNFNINTLKTSINNKLDNIYKIKQLFDNFEKNTNFGSELKEILKGKKLSDAIEDTLKNISLIVRLFDSFKLFLQLSVEIINKNH